MKKTNTKPQEQGSTAGDFIPEELIDKGICPLCNGELESRLENLGFDTNPKDVVSIYCKECGTVVAR